MNKSNAKINAKTLFITQAAVIAALYAALTVAQDLITLGTASSPLIQFRLAEALCLLAVFTPAAIPGLTIGCAVANIVAVNAGIVGFYDIFIGSFASLLAVLSIYFLRNVRVFKLPVAAALMPAVFNGVILGIEFSMLESFELFLTNATIVAAGELGVCLTLGLLLVFTIEKSGLQKKLFFLNTGER